LINAVERPDFLLGSRQGRQGNGKSMRYELYILHTVSVKLVRAARGCRPNRFCWIFSPPSATRSAPCASSTWRFGVLGGSPSAAATVQGARMAAANAMAIVQRYRSTGIVGQPWRGCSMRIAIDVRSRRLRATDHPDLGPR